MQNIKNIFKNGGEFLNQKVKISGWIRTTRSSGDIGFIELNDGTFFKSLQVVFDAGLDNFAKAGSWGTGSSIEVEGMLVSSPAAGQPFELKAEKIDLVCSASEDYPLQKKRHSFEFLRDIAHLRGRSNTFSAVFRLCSVLSYAIHKFFQEKGFVYVHTPIITTSDCEGAGEMFQVTTLDLKNVSKNEKGDVDFANDFFGARAGLTVSGQLNGEAMAMAFNKIYTFGPTFRAENSNTTRHASEFWMIEPEIAFAGILEDMALAEEMIKYLIRYVLVELPEEMEFFNKFIDQTLLERLNNIVSSDFGKITYTEAVDILKKSGKKFDYPVEWGIDLQTEHERYLTDEVFKKPVFVINYPKAIKAFYMKENDDGKTVAAMDLLAPGIGEIIGGSQREDDFLKLEKRMAEVGLNKEDYQWYLDLRRYGGAPHAGFGLGFERAIMYLSGMTNIRDVIPFPRTPGNAKF